MIKQIHKKFAGQQGIWSNYVKRHLLPRLNGFELLMASYAMAHLQLDLLLTETGYKPTKDQRFKVFLTNSLEESHPDTGTLFANWLSTEANEANRIIRDTPVMCVIGNPPYAVSSSNKSIDSEGKKTWIGKLIDDYKKDLNERKINLDDDYIKFIRYGQHFIDKNGSGILAYISNNSFIDGITHRQMRKHLLESFDKIYILDLHGSAKKNEAAVDGSKDENVFDIQQGVSINIFIRSDLNKKGRLTEVNHFDFYGRRLDKYHTLSENTLNSINWNKIDIKEPNFFFVPKDFSGDKIYNVSFSLSDIFLENGSGVKNERDDICKQFTRSEMVNVINDFRNLSEGEIKSKYHVKDTRDWKVLNAKKDVLQNNNDNFYVLNLYRPFDERYTYYTGTTRGFIGTPGSKRMYHLINKNNIGLLTCRQQSTFDFQHVFVTKHISDICSLSSQTKETGYVLPLYVYPNTPLYKATARIPNLDVSIVELIGDSVSLTFTNEKETTPNTFAPIDILDYIYAVLHSPAYREKYKEFFKIDFPRVPYPKDATTFWQLVKLGGEIRQIHLLESPVVEQYITQYPIDGDNTVRKVKYQDGKVYINEIQYFANVPELAWNFYIGGYQPAQKWLKDRKDRKLEFDDILHYQKIIVALAETERLMREIDKVGVE
ncbi:type ISP restriction/modification enzyme [Segetibacter koreensis]|uniref:type ISP restriction/modification enzyme n=1 Tax=Segetibacter koreensis TaxID=398037 RepID=UPI001FDF5C9A|nr:type ISP restriction/modification enzyme [Segetibacter koreensis]